MMPRGLLVAAALAASGCVTTPKTADAGPAGAAAERPALLTDSRGRQYRVICRMERPTGSNIAEKVCKPEILGSDEGRRTQDMLLEPASRGVLGRGAN